jgi:protein translocase SecG subunit
MISTILFGFQTILAVLLIVAVLLQQKGGGLGAAFGGSGTIEFERRGADKILYQATVIISIIFFAVSLAQILI